MNEIITLDEHTPPAGSAGSAVAVRSDVDTDSALDLLQYVASWDNRKASRAQAEAWALSAQMAGWTLAEAKDAVRWLLTHDTAYLTPAAVTARIESQRRRARLADDGVNEDGTRKVTHAAAVAVWRNAFRSVGPNPSADQETKAAELLEQMLDGAGDPVAVLNAAVLAGRQMTPRIDWQLERIASGEERSQFVHSMPLCPVEYIPDSRLDIGYAVGQSDFPPEWRVYDPLPEDTHKLVREALIPEFRACMARGSQPDYDLVERDLPDWLTEHLADSGIRNPYTGELTAKGPSDEERAAEAKRHVETRSRAHKWLKDDRTVWEHERLAVVRDWYATHPNRRRAFEQGPGTGGWWEN